MAESRLLIILCGTGKTGFGKETAEELEKAGLTDITDAVRSLPSRLGIRVSVASRETTGHISGAELVPLFEDGFLSGISSVCVVGTNAPQIPISYMIEAFGRLTPHRRSVVLGPAVRGGWYLLGASGTAPRSLLKDFCARASNVFTETQQQTVAGELSISLLPSLQSLETPSDGQRLLRDMRRGVASAPRTQYTLRKLVLE